MERCGNPKIEGVGPAIETADRQIEFSMAVPVCAWCEPRKPGATRVAVTHGICPRHLKQLKLETQKIYCQPAGNPPTPARMAMVRLTQAELSVLQPAN